MREQLELLQKQAEKKTESDAVAETKTPESVSVPSLGAEPLLREQKRDSLGRSWGLGRRKNSSSRVYIRPGHGKITINGKKSEEYLKRPVSQMLIEQPLKVTNTLGSFDIVCNVFGGGLSGQAGAVRHAISRALVNFDPDHYKILREFGYMTRDPRVVERKKPGRPKARKKFQFSKR